MTRVSLLAFAFIFAMHAHDITKDVTIQMFFKPEGNLLQLAVRGPMRTMRDQQFPETKSGHLELANIDPLLKDSATVWLVDALQVEENGVGLPRPEIAEARVALQSDRSFSSWDMALAHLNSPPLAARRFRFEWPEFTPQLLSATLHWALAMVAIAAALCFVSSIARKSERIL